MKWRYALLSAWLGACVLTTAAMELPTSRGSIQTRWEVRGDVALFHLSLDDEPPLSMRWMLHGGELQSEASFGSLGSVHALETVNGPFLIAQSLDRCERLPKLETIVAMTELLSAVDPKRGIGEEEGWTLYGMHQLLRAATEACPGTVDVENGYCTIQPTFAGCTACCDIESHISSILVRACTGTGGALASIAGGGPWGAVAGGTVAYAVCDLLLNDTSCYDHCEGKDGDGTPISCYDPSNPSVTGVCRTICENPYNNVGATTCPSQLDLWCCVDEYEPPSDEDCPPSICPGPSCPPQCGF